MKKILALFLGLVFLVVFADEPLGLGITYLTQNNHTDVGVDTVAPAGTLFTITYGIDAVQNMAGYTSIFAKLDTIQDSIVCVIKLQETYDNGTTWEYTTLLCSIATTAASIDTGFEVNLYPTPKFRLLLINIAAGADSISVEDMIMYNQPR